MTYELTGRLFPNDRKETDKHPDMSGDFVDASGVKMRVAAWWKPSKKGGDDWLSFQVSPIQPRTESQEQRTETPAPQSSDSYYDSQPEQESEIPF